MAITDFNVKDRAIQLGNRNDICYMCETELASKKFKNEQDYRKERFELKGKLEGKSVFKIKSNGREIVTCMECLCKVVDEYRSEKA